MKSSFGAIFISILWSATVLVVSSTGAYAENLPEKTSPVIVKPALPGEKVNIDFNDVDIKLFVKFIAELTGRNFIIDDKVKGKVTIISPKKVTANEAMKVFESTMEVYGYSLIEAGSVTKIIPAVEARQRGSFKAGPIVVGDRMITRLIPLKHIRADELVNTLRPLVPPTSFITSYARTNTLILADYFSNTEKIMSIVNQLDTPGHEETITVVQLKYAGAKEMASKLDKTFGSKSSAKGRRRPGAPPGKPMRRPGGPIGVWTRAEPKIIPDERINSLVIVADAAQTESILSLIEQLDIKAPPGRGNINVYYLQNADAEDLAKTLNNITKEQSKKRGKKGGAPSSSKLQDKVIITPDKPTNSLVITASVEDYETIRDIIEKLDIRRQQVFVEALIMEVSSNQQRRFGVEWRTTADFTENKEQVIGGFGTGVISSVAQDPLNAPPGLIIGVVDGIISFGGRDFLNIGALMHALESETGINILSTPNIMTTDNEEAEIIVAQNVPFVTGESQTTGGTTLTTIERRNIGITLRLTPQISGSGDVKLSVYQEISSISPTQLDKARDLITFTRSVKTTVIVRDGQNIVIGGLIRDDVNEVETKVPFLGDIPLLGWLFKSVSKQKTKTNLLVFLTPHIIRNDEDLENIMSRREGLLNQIPEESKKRIPMLNEPEPDPADNTVSSEMTDDEEDEDY